MNSKIAKKFIILIALAFSAAFVVNIAWSMRVQYDAIVSNLHMRAQLVTRELSAAWQFVNVNQDLINTDREGNYEFKGLHCAIVGKSISAIFSKGNEQMTVHYTNWETRNPNDAPDAFEKQALAAMRENPKRVWEYYDVVDIEGEKVFRYLASLTVTESCLDCHGEPAGDLDKTGFVKEGWKLGDMGGAISMKISMEKDMAAYRDKVVKDVLFSSVCLLGVCFLVGIAVRRWVTKPLAVLEAGVQQMATGDLDVSLEEKRLAGEFRALGQNFNHMASELAELYSNMEQQVKSRTSELSEANRLLEEQAELLSRANKLLKEDVDLKTSFLNMMSHELRTPLTAILVFTNILLEGELGEEERSCLQEIQINGNNLLGMINNTLEMARLEAGRSVLHPELVDMGEVFASIESVIGPLAGQKNIEFSTEVAGDVPLVWADAQRLRHIVENLCSNAIKFTPEGGHVAVRAEVCCDGGEQENEAVGRDGAVQREELQIHVQDDGIGIKKEEQARIFDLFVQSDDSEARRYNGSGLGLALAQDLAKLHGGRITVVSEFGAGSCFTLHLPLKEGEKA